MSGNNVVQVPAHILARQMARQQSGQKSSTMTAVINGDGYAFPKVSIRAGRFRLVEDGVETPVGINLDVILVGANPNISKVFYGKPFDGALDVRPDCFSHDGVTPDASIADPISKSCVGCPHNALGSEVTPSGAKSKMCGDQRHLAVVPAADPTKPYALTISVTSMKNLREYFKELQNYGLAPEEVVTELGFDETVSFPKVTFKQKGYVAEKAIERVDAIVQSEDVKEVVRLVPPRPRTPALGGTAGQPAIADDTVRTQGDAGAAVASAATGQQPAKPAVDDAYEEEATAAEVVKPAAKAKATAVKDEPKAEVKAEVKAEAKVEDAVGVAAPEATADAGLSAIESKLDSLFSDD